MLSRRNFFYIIIFSIFLLIIYKILLQLNKPVMLDKSINYTTSKPSSFTSSTLIGKTDIDWKKILTPEQYYILREKGTETPFSSPLDTENRPGTYYSVGCNEPVFRSEQKYDSGTGWPSFWAPIAPDALILKTDKTLGITRTEVLDKCGGHLGHVFNDGPQPTGLRFCINGVVLIFVPDPDPKINL